MKRSVVPHSPAFVGSLLVGLILCVGTRAVHADLGTLPGGATLTFGRTFVHEGNIPDVDHEASTPDALLQYFNAAHCTCAQMGAATVDPYFESTFGQEIVVTGSTTPIAHPLQFWAGVDCDMEVERDVRCSHVAADIPLISTIATMPAVVDINIYSLINAKPGTSGCDPETSPANSFLWAMADTDGNSSIDFAKSKSFVTDVKPPPLPTNFSAQGAENSVVISWTAPADSTDVFAFQALCTNADDTAVTTVTRPAARYFTPKTLCGANALSLMQVQLDQPGEVDAGMGVNEPEGIATQDPTFLCGETTESTATSLTIKGLVNNKPYKVALLALDRAGNATGVFFENLFTPKPSTDFWEDLHGRGGKTEGGFCLIAETYGDDNPLTRALRTFRDDTLAETTFGRSLSHAYYASLAKLGAVVHGHLVLRIISGVLLLPLVAIALLWHVLTLPGLLLLVGLGWLVRRRSRLRVRSLTALGPLALRTAAGAAIAVVLLAPHHAHAQTPYWEHQNTTDETASAVADGPARVSWHAGVRLGPYIPGIDKQLGLSPGPYKAMYGTTSNPSAYAVLPMLDVERIVWRGFGQLGFGGSGGYMSKSANSFLDGSDPNDPNRPRSMADKNTFHLVPLSMNVVYRFTYLDDNYGIPLVPYLRGGLAYYIWWVTKTDGSFSSVCADGSTMDPCPTSATNKGDGASLGLEGSIGLAIRAERIDATAAQSMRDSGIEHAGFYAEYHLSKVDGFGSSKKLSVGDNTWFAGVDFEF